MKNIKIIFSDFIGLCRLCGPLIGFRWLFMIVNKFHEIRQRGTLLPADQAMAGGPFLISKKGCNKFRIGGFGAISGIREMYVRDTYLHNGLLRINDGDTVVDLGANMGNFTNLALSCGPNVRVVSVEPSLGLNSVFRSSVGLNDGYLERTTLIRGFLGNRNPKLESLLASDSNYVDASWVSESELISKAGLEKIDFLKCDIEGGEYGLLDNSSKLLAMTQAIAIEIHAFAGNVHGFIDYLKSCGFSILTIKWDPDGTCTALAKRL